jgi:hypothetical protein
LGPAAGMVTDSNQSPGSGRLFTSAFIMAAAPSIKPWPDEGQG